VKKKDLRTGMFGVMDNGAKFVIVNEFFVYKDGGFDYVRSINDDLSFGLGFAQIDGLYECDSFDQLECAIDDGKLYPCIWKRNEFTEMTISEIEKKLGIKNLRIKKED
jgi:hypothetical protein